MERRALHNVQASNLIIKIAFFGISNAHTYTHTHTYIHTHTHRHTHTHTHTHTYIHTHIPPSNACLLFIASSLGTLRWHTYVGHLPTLAAHTIMHTHTHTHTHTYIHTHIDTHTPTHNI